MAAYCDFDSLAALIKAPSKDTLVKICNEAYRHGEHIPEDILNNTAKTLGINSRKTKQVMTSLSSLLKTAVFHGYTEPKQILTLFPKDFHKNLRDLLIKITADNMNTWRNQALDNQVSLSRLADFDWRVDIKTSSDTIARMSVPTCILQMKVQGQSDNEDQSLQTENVNVELSKETLDTMLDGLSKIRDQLSSVAKR